MHRGAGAAAAGSDRLLSAVRGGDATRAREYLGVDARPRHADERARRRHHGAGRRRTCGRRPAARCRKRSCPSRRSRSSRFDTAVVGGRLVQVTPQPDFTFRARRGARGDHAEHAGRVPDQPEQPDRRVDAARGDSHDRAARAGRGRRVRRRGVRRVRRRDASSPSSTRFRTSSSGGRSRRRSALPGLRIGCLVGAPDTLDPIRRAVPVYSVNIAAVVAVQAALDDLDYLHDYLRQVDESKALLYAACDRLGLTYWKSDANFVLVSRRRSHRRAGRRRARARHLPARPLDRAGLRRLHPHRRPASSSTRAAASRDGRGPVRRARDRSPDDRDADRARDSGSTARGSYQVRTGIRFLDHMLELFARHGGVRSARSTPPAISTSISTTPSKISASRSARRSRRRSATGAASTAPATSSCRWTKRWRSPRSISAAGRTPSSTSRSRPPRVGDLQTELVHDFFEGFAIGARANVHVKVLYGRSSHHKIEAVFKAFARALRVACAKDKRLARMLPQHQGTAVIALIDYKAGNLTSVQEGARAIGADVFVPEAPDELARGARHHRAWRRPFRRDARARRRLDRGDPRARRRRPAAARHLPRHAVAVRGQRRGARPAGARPAVGPMLPAQRRREPTRTRVKVPHVGWNSARDCSATASIVDRRVRPARRCTSPTATSRR